MRFVYFLQLEYRLRNAETKNWNAISSNRFIIIFLLNCRRFKAPATVKELSLCLFEVLNVHHLRDQPLTNRQTDKLTTITL